MILGMTNFTFAHVVLSLIGILSRFVVLYGLLTANRMLVRFVISSKNEHRPPRGGHCPRVTMVRSALV